MYFWKETAEPEASETAVETEIASTDDLEEELETDLEEELETDLEEELETTYHDIAGDELSDEILADFETAFGIKCQG